MLSGKKRFCSKMSSSRRGVFLVSNNREKTRRAEQPGCGRGRIRRFETHLGRGLASTKCDQPQPSAATGADADADADAGGGLNARLGSQLFLLINRQMQSCHDK